MMAFSSLENGCWMFNNMPDSSRLVDLQRTPSAKDPPTAQKGGTDTEPVLRPAAHCVPGRLLLSHEGGGGRQGAAEVLADVDLLRGGRAVDGLLPGHLHWLPLALHGWGEGTEMKLLMLAGGAIKLEGGRWAAAAYSPASFQRPCNAAVGSTGSGCGGAC